MKIKWNAFKGFIDNKNLNIQLFEYDNYYHAAAFDGSLMIECEIDKNASDTTDLYDFETNYKEYCNNKISIVDSNNIPLIKNQVVGSDWHYEPRAFDFFVGKYKSLYNRKFSGSGSIAGANDYGDAVMKFYNADGQELLINENESDEDYQLRLNSSCTMTDVTWTPMYDHKCIGASIQTVNTPSWSCYLWADVDLSSFGLSSIPYLAGGLNLRFNQDGIPFKVDARTASDTPLPPGIPLVFRVRHDIVNDNNRFGLQIFLEHYKE